MVMISENHKLAFFDLPKVASTTVKTWMYELETGENFVKDWKAGRSIHILHPTLPDVTDAMVDRYRDYWRFTVVRDPASRILSAYSNRIFQHNALKEPPVPGLRAAVMGLTMEPDAEEFLRRLSRYRRHSADLRHHTELMSAFLGNDLSKFAVYRIDQMDRLQADLGERVGAPVVFENLQPDKAKDRRVSARDLSPQAFAALMEYCEPDYRMLEGYYERPVREAKAKAT